MSAHTLYRFWDATGNLLYVGISSDIGRRLNQHSKDKVWFTEVDHITTEHYPDRESVLAAEYKAIVAEQPKWNIAHNAPQNRPADPAKIVQAQAPKVLQEGVVVALALRRGRYRTPVGLVIESTHEHATLSLYRWHLGYFDGGKITVAIGDIMTLRFADTFTPTQAAKLGYGLLEGVFNMDPLAEFQSEWSQVFAHDRQLNIGHPANIAATHPPVRIEATYANPGARNLAPSARWVPEGADGCLPEPLSGHPGFRRHSGQDAPRVPDGARSSRWLTYNARAQGDEIPNNPKIGHPGHPGHPDEELR